MTHYDTLEVSRTASPEVIRAAYRSLIGEDTPRLRVVAENDAPLLVR